MVVGIFREPEVIDTAVFIIFSFDDHSPTYACKIGQKKNTCNVDI